MSGCCQQLGGAKALLESQQYSPSQEVDPVPGPPRVEILEPARCGAVQLPHLQGTLEVLWAVTPITQQ